MISDPFLSIVCVAPFWTLLIVVLSFFWVVFVLIYFYDDYFGKK